MGPTVWTVQIDVVDNFFLALHWLGESGSGKGEILVQVEGLLGMALLQIRSKFRTLLDEKLTALFYQLSVQHLILLDRSTVHIREGGGVGNGLMGDLVGMGCTMFYRVF